MTTLQQLLRWQRCSKWTWWKHTHWNSLQRIKNKTDFAHFSVSLKLALFILKKSCFKYVTDVSILVVTDMLTGNVGDALHHSTLCHFFICWDLWWNRKSYALTWRIQHWLTAIPRNHGENCLYIQKSKFVDRKYTYLFQYFCSRFLFHGIYVITMWRWFWVILVLRLRTCDARLQISINNILSLFSHY